MNSQARVVSELLLRVLRGKADSDAAFAGVAAAAADADNGGGGGGGDDDARFESLLARMDEDAATRAFLSSSTTTTLQAVAVKTDDGLDVRLSTQIGEDCSQFALEAHALKRRRAFTDPTDGGADAGDLTRVEDVQQHIVVSSLSESPLYALYTAGVAVYGGGGDDVAKSDSSGGKAHAAQRVSTQVQSALLELEGGLQSAAHTKVQRALVKLEGECLFFSFFAQIQCSVSHLLRRYKTKMLQLDCSAGKAH
jgi:hypothetical protein